MWSVVSGRTFFFSKVKNIVKAETIVVILDTDGILEPCYNMVTSSACICTLISDADRYDRCM